MPRVAKSLINSALIAGLLITSSACNRSYESVSVQPELLPGQNVPMVEAAAVPGQILIKRKAGIKNIKLVGMKHLSSIKRLNIDIVQASNRASLNMTLKSLKNNPSIEYAVPNYIRKIIVPRKKHSRLRSLRRKSNNLININDPQRKDQYALDVLQAEKAWAITKGSSGVTVAIVDTGIDLGHPDLKSRVVPGFSAIEKNTNGKDDNGHGTHVAGITAATIDNNIGIAGLAPNCRLMPIKVLDEFGSGDDSGIIEGIIWAVDHGADIINMSLGGVGTSQAFEDAIQYAIKHNVAVIAAMGNDGENLMNYPAASDGAIAVGSTDASDKISDFSNFGDWISVSAPGSEILSTFPTYDVDLNNYGFPKNYAYLDGTSMATPYVSGLAALVLSKYGKMSPKQLKSRLEKSSDDLGSKGFDKYFGYGRINPFKALSD